ncbi:hypothetical protein NC653_026881 [Populus alba x Populus x berolinensis]|uniref:Uncharacterized protein n=1 Tax=Populus alba x Populus x berolinensis TaxID=444605 RepID=A0AAD6M417_9ROSI|nr:hypothetical protein NC653_026881 [Populus alba x Populus x berolinensis]
MEQMGWAKDGCQNKYVKNSLLTNLLYVAARLSDLWLSSDDGHVIWINVKNNRPFLFWKPPDVLTLKWNVDVGNKDSNKTELLAVVKAIDLSPSKNDFFGLNFLVESDSASVRGPELIGSLEYKFLQLEFSIVLSREEVSLDFTDNEDEEYVDLPRAEKQETSSKSMRGPRLGLS